MSILSNKITPENNPHVLSSAKTREMVENIQHAHKVANDSLYHELEARFGCAFAQWIVDRL